MAGWGKKDKGPDKLDYGMELFGNLNLSGRAERQEKNQRRLHEIFEHKAGNIVARRLYYNTMPFTIEKLEQALTQLEDKKLTRLNWWDTRLVRNWLKFNLQQLYLQRERDMEENWHSKF